MNGTYYKNPTFPGDGESVPNNNYTSTIVPVGTSELPMEQSYIENILRLNKGKHAKAYISFPDSVNWKDKIFDGSIEQAGRDHLVMRLENGQWVLVPMIYLDYVEFDEEITYKPALLRENKIDEE